MMKMFYETSKFFAKSWEIFAELKINEIKPVQLTADIAAAP